MTILGSVVQQLRLILCVRDIRGIYFIRYHSILSQNGPWKNSNSHNLIEIALY